MSEPHEVFNSETLRDAYRAIRYFRDDLHLILLLLSLTACSTALVLLQAWPLAVLVDSALGTASIDSWMHRLFLAPLPDNPISRIVGLGIMALVLRFAHELIAMARRCSLRAFTTTVCCECAVTCIESFKGCTSTIIVHGR